VNLEQANIIMSEALAYGRSQNLKSLAVIVLDAGGHAIGFVREDGASFFRHDIARAKAVGALGMGDDTRVLADRANTNPAFFQSVTAVVGGNIAFSPGGVLVRNADGFVIGAVGISGDTGDMDEACAFAGIKAAGLRCSGS
jgi:uncharacterized protein GlcG (DUF336 family)